MRPVARVAVVSFALTNLYLLALVGPLVSPQHELIFHLPSSATLLFLPAILDILLVFGVLLAALLLVRRNARAELLLWSGLLLALPSGLITTVYGFENTNVPLTLGWPVASLALLCFLAINLRPRVPLTRFRRIRRVTATLLGFLALPELLMFLQLIAYGWQARHLNPAFVPAPARAVAGAVENVQRPRIVWIVLDELAYDQVYGRRYPGLALPNFDRLAAESAVFTNAASAAEYTRHAIPSLIVGLPLRGTQPSIDGHRLALYPRDSHNRSLLDPQDTVFADAQRAGLQTAVAGWYEPYCRLLPGVLNRCFWTYSDELPAGLTTDGTLLQHTMEPFFHFLRLSIRPAGIGPVMPTPGALDVRRHRADYGALLRASDALFTSGQPGLVFLHMPIPHPWGFYDRANGTFPDHRTSYLDNLVLADAYIGRVRGELEAKGLWESTNFLVMGDHTWRTTNVWASSAHWTAEEQAASHGGAYDGRPAVILKLAHEHTTALLTAPFDAVRTRALIDGLIEGRITSPAKLGQWVADPAEISASHRSPTPEPAR